MAVPKKKTSKSKRDMRRAHDSLTPAGISTCPQCSETKLPHRACAGCGTYKGQNVSGSED